MDIARTLGLTADIHIDKGGADILGVDLEGIRTRFGDRLGKCEAKRIVLLAGTDLIRAVLHGDPFGVRPNQRALAAVVLG